MAKEERTLAINGAEYYVATYGGDNLGETILLVHGMPDTGAMWDNLQAGGSEALRGEKIFPDILELISKLGLPKCHVVGHDWGGYVAWELVINAPDQFKSHVAISMSHPLVFSTSLNLQSLRDNWYMYLNTQDDIVDLYTKDDCAFYREFIIPTHPEADEVCARLKDPVAMNGMRNWDRGNPLASLYLAARTPGALTPYYTKVAVPTMGVWSAGDTYLLEEHMQQSGEHCADFEYRRFSRSTLQVTTRVTMPPALEQRISLFLRTRRVTA
ncbi:alpha/beta-hydrolase [Chloropicon primus]|uniref:Alpha/beta-hydrolase n=2 Tax=Chloropicon primus TaxID=1764295 RepID=A0A5B8MI75_9CHLO|nr:alpha/beta-hydrolase [Chloropicon primus]|eukprot:QDZ20338.1 alpha/beta-hydrolase [Chloropicon primus]